MPTSIILISNWSGFKEITSINQGYYRYSNLTGTLTKIEIFIQGRVMSRDYALGRGDWKRFKEENNGSNDTLTYRLFKINPLKFWRWGEYIFNWRYRLPYANWADIEKRRGYGILKYSNSFQAF